MRVMVGTQSRSERLTNRLTNKTFVEGKSIDSLCEMFSVTRENCELIIEHIFKEPDSPSRFEEAVFNLYKLGAPLDEIAGRFRVSGPMIKYTVKRHCERVGVDYGPLKEHHDKVTKERLRQKAKDFWNKKKDERASRFRIGQSVFARVPTESQFEVEDIVSAVIVGIGNDSDYPTVLIEYMGYFNKIKTFVRESAILEFG